MVLNLTTTFKASIAVQVFLHELLYIGWILDREILVPWTVFEQKYLFCVLKVQAKCLLHFIPSWDMEIFLSISATLPPLSPTKSTVSFALEVLYSVLFCQGTFAALLCDPGAGGVWHAILPRLECHIWCPSSRNNCVLGTLDWKRLSKLPNPTFQCCREL